MKLRQLAASALLLPLLAGCASDQELNGPDLSSSNGLMQRYVAMGNSITAGFQSAGINDSTQRQSYAVLFARQAGAPFFVPSLAMPGCPAPFTNNVTQTRVGGGGGGDCALREENHYPYVSNVAVPGATTFSPTDNDAPGSSSNPLTTFILGGRTQVEAMQDANPTFVSLWIGNNDVLGAVTNSADPGNEALITPLPAFQANYSATLDAIEETGAQAALLSVADVSAIPYASLGVIYFCLKNGGCPAPLPPQNPVIAAIPFTVLPSCAPGALGGVGETSLIPWTVGIARIGAAAQGTPTTLDCALDTDAILASEVATIQQAVTDFNAYIAAQAAQRGWAYVDVNPTLLALKATGEIPAFPDISQLATGGPVTFGPYFSLDGVHPSGAAHRLVADLMIEVVNETYETEIPELIR